MLISIFGKQPLNYYIIKFKQEQTHCAQCHKELGRIMLVLNEKIVTKDMIMEMKEYIDESMWLELRDKLLALCRFCREIYCYRPTYFFELHSFKQYLFLQTGMQHSTVREYVTRLRRIDESVLALNLSIPNLTISNIETLLPKLVPKTTLMNHVSTLRKYEAYVSWSQDMKDNE